jgi:hypothetical protein
MLFRIIGIISIVNYSHELVTTALNVGLHYKLLAYYEQYYRYDQYLHYPSSGDFTVQGIINVALPKLHSLGGSWDFLLVGPGLGFFFSNS